MKHGNVNHVLKEVKEEVARINMTKKLAKQIQKDHSIPGSLPAKDVYVCSAMMANEVWKLVKKTLK
jgi:hypothetical protein